jgi:hypothetical protein
MNLRPWVYTVLGIALVGFALVFSNGDLARILAGRDALELSWGPALFRVLLIFHGILLAGYGWVGSGRRPAPVEAPRSSGRVWWIVGALTALALALRLYRLNTGLWLDEILTLVDFARPPLRHIVSSFANQNQHMLYSVLSHISMSIFGEHAWSLRLPAALLGTATVPVLFLTGRRIAGEREALFSCALLTVSYHHIWFSQNARGYSGLLLFTLLSTWLWIEALERRQWRWWLGYVAATTGGLWIHLTLVFVVAAQALIYLVLAAFRSREAPLGWQPFAAWILSGTLTVQLYALSLPEFLRSALGETSMNSDWTNPIWSILETLRVLQIGFSGLAVVLCGGAMVAAGWLSIVRRSVRAGLVMVLPGIMGAAYMLFSAHNFWPRFFFFLMGFALLIAIHGATVAAAFIARVLPPRQRAVFAMRLATVAASAVIVASAATVPRCYRLPKQDFAGARDYVEGRRTARDAVVTLGLAGHAYGKYYAPQWTVISTPEEFEQLRRTHDRILLVYTLGIELKAFHPELWRIVNAEFAPVRVFPGTLGGGEVYVCEERSHPLTATTGKF